MSLPESRQWCEVAKKALLRIERYASEHNNRKLKEARDPERSVFLRAIKELESSLTDDDKEQLQTIEVLKVRFDRIVKESGLIIPSPFCSFVSYCNRQEGVLKAHLWFMDQKKKWRRSDEKIEIPVTQTKVWDILETLIQSPNEWNPLPEGLTLKNTFKNGDGTMMILQYIHSRSRPGGGAAKDYSLKDKPFL